MDGAAVGGVEVVLDHVPGQVQELVADRSPAATGGGGAGPAGIARVGGAVGAEGAGAHTERGCGEDSDLGPVHDGVSW